MTVTKTTSDWLDFYSLVLDQLAESLVNPTATYKRLGILDEYKQTQKMIAPGNKQSAAPAMPGKLDFEAYKDGQASWKRVRADIKAYGIEPVEDLELSPPMEVMGTPIWNKSPYLELWRTGESRPVTFRGRDALTALGFLNFYIQHCEDVNPKEHIKKTLAARGITKENYRERVPLSEIANPFDDETPSSKES